MSQTHICETTPGVKAYSGYVNVPATLLDTDYNVSTFFWYFEARENPQDAPLAMYLAGGPGQSSLYAATGQGGPCYINRDSKTLTLNSWSWNNNVNLLYIDQPVQSGFSYDALVSGILQQVPGIYTPEPFTSDPPFQPNSTTTYGTIPSQILSHTANTSQQVARQLYQFTQVWVNE